MDSINSLVAIFKKILYTVDGMSLFISGVFLSNSAHREADVCIAFFPVFYGSSLFEGERCLANALGKSGRKA